MILVGQMKPSGFTFAAWSQIALIEQAHKHKNAGGRQDDAVRIYGEWSWDMIKGVETPTEPVTRTVRL